MEQCLLYLCVCGGGGGGGQVFNSVVNGPICLGEYIIVKFIGQASVVRNISQ